MYLKVFTELGFFELSWNQVRGGKEIVLFLCEEECYYVIADDFPHEHNVASPPT